MARILMVVPPLTGHINPAVATARALRARGHTVAWAAHESTLRRHIGADETVFDLPPFTNDAFESQRHLVRGLDSVRFFYEAFCVPLAEHCFAAVELAVRDYRPDLLLCDHQMVAGALVAHRRQIPWLTLITTPAAMVDMSPAINGWVAQQFAVLKQRCGVTTGGERPDFSPYGCVVFSTPDLYDDSLHYFDAPYHFVGAAIEGRQSSVEFPWERLNTNLPRVLISLGTVTGESARRFYDTVIAALGGQPLQAILVAPESLQLEVPDNFILRNYVPQLELIPRVDLVLCHAGHNTVCESLYFGKPLLVAPIRDDQPAIAAQAVRAGVALRLRFGKVSPAEVRDAVFTVLREPSYRQHALRLQQGLLRLGGCDTIVALAERSLAGSLEGEIHANAQA